MKNELSTKLYKLDFKDYDTPFSVMCIDCKSERC